MPLRLAGLLLLLGLLAPLPCPAQQEAAFPVWITCNTPVPDHVVFNWVSPTPGDSRVELRLPDGTTRQVHVSGRRKLHHVKVPLGEPHPGAYRYRVQTGNTASPWWEFQGLGGKQLRVAVVANWHRHVPLRALEADRPQLLLTAGDNIPNLHSLCGVGKRRCIEPYLKLVRAYPELFRSVIFLPALGNHDKQIRPRGRRFPPEPVYDVAAEAFRRFVELPGEELWWHLDVPWFEVRFAALDLHHTSDQGTTWQSASSFGRNSRQYAWYRALMAKGPRYTITLYNEKHSLVRRLAGGAWEPLLRKNTLCVAGFGHFAERAATAGVTYYNTSLRGTGDRYPDAHSQFLASQDNYLLITLDRSRRPVRLQVEIKNLEGKTLDRMFFLRSDPPRVVP